MVLPSLVVGNELLIVGGVCGAVGVWILAYRHGQLRGLVDAVKMINTQDLPGKSSDNSWLEKFVLIRIVTSGKNCGMENRKYLCSKKPTYENRQ